MHIIDIWLEEIKIFAPSNLKNLIKGIAYNLAATFRYLFIDWWWFSLLILFSHIIMYWLITSTMHSALILLLQGLFLAAKAFYAFLATLAAFPTQLIKSPNYYTSRQMFVWPIVTPFVLWEFFSWHFFKFFCLLFNCQVVAFAKLIASFLMLVQVDWFASAPFMFFAFIIIGSHAMHGIAYSLEHAFGMLFYTYPVSAVMFALLYALNYLLYIGVMFIALINLDLGLIFNPMVILIPVAAVLFGAVFQWHMGLVDDYE